MLRSHTLEGQAELRRTLREFYEGRLHIGGASKVPVTSLRQALAIGRARARRKDNEPAPGQWHLERPE